MLSSHRKSNSSEWLDCSFLIPIYLSETPRCIIIGCIVPHKDRRCNGLRNPTGKIQQKRKWLYIVKALVIYPQHKLYWQFALARGPLCMIRSSGKINHPRYTERHSNQRSTVDAGKDSRRRNARQFSRTVRQRAFSARTSTSGRSQYDRVVIIH